MGYAAANLQQGIRRVVLTQTLLTLIVAIGFLFTLDMFHAVAACYGGAITVLSTWWLGRRLQLAGELALRDVKGGQISLYGGVALRFVTVLVLLGVGIGLLKLAPIPLITAFAVAQLGFLLNLGSTSMLPK